MTIYAPALPGIKPSIWSPTSPGLVPPEWQWAWHGLVGAWLFQGGGGTTVGDLFSINNLTFSGTTQWEQQPYGLSVQGVSGNFPGLRLTTPSAILKPTAVTIMWHGIVVAAGTVDNDPYLVGMSYHSDGSNPYAAYAIARGDAATDIYFQWNQASAFKSFLVHTQVTYGAIANYILCVQPGDQRGYKNGVLIGSSTLAGVITYGAAPYFQVGNHTTAAAQNTRGSSGLILVWNRALSHAECILLSTDPFAPFRMAEEEDLYVPVAAGGLSIPVAIHHYKLISEN